MMQIGSRVTARVHEQVLQALLVPQRKVEVKWRNEIDVVSSGLEHLQRSDYRMVIPIVAVTRVKILVAVVPISNERGIFLRQ